MCRLRLETNASTPRGPDTREYVPNNVLVQIEPERGSPSKGRYVLLGVSMSAEATSKDDGAVRQRARRPGLAHSHHSRNQRTVSVQRPAVCGVSRSAVETSLREWARRGRVGREVGSERHGGRRRRRGVCGRHEQTLGPVERAESRDSRQRWTLRRRTERVDARVRRRSLFCALTGNAILLCVLLTLLSAHKHTYGPCISPLMLLPGRLRRAHALRLGLALVEPTPAHPPEP
jgi:hypothetical protein